MKLLDSFLWRVISRYQTFTAYTGYCDAGGVAIVYTITILTPKPDVAGLPLIETNEKDAMKMVHRLLEKASEYNADVLMNVTGPTTAASCRRKTDG
jgi:hypothetical protein